MKETIDALNSDQWLFPNEGRAGNASHAHGALFVNVLVFKVPDTNVSYIF